MIDYEYEADFLDGLEPFVRAELAERFGSRVRYAQLARPDALPFTYDGALAGLLELRSVVAVSLVLFFPVPRPKALLGHQYLTQLLTAIAAVRELWQPGRFTTLKMSAAGEASSVMQRLKSELEQHTGLRPDQEEGDLLLRLRRDGAGWQVLIRLSPRPLAARPWRVCNMPGALNASLAHALIMLSQPHSSDRVLNMACGSGTLMIERLAVAPARVMIGCDTDPAALECARANIAAAENHEIAAGRPVRLEAWDAIAVPMPDASFDMICADLPFGQLIGSHRDNQVLYPRIFIEAARLARPGARFVLITHEVRLLERIAGDFADVFRLQRVLQVRSSGMTPRVYLFERQA